AGGQLLVGTLQEGGGAEAEGVGDAGAVAEVEVVLGVDGVAVERTLVALVAVVAVAVVLQLDGAVVGEQQDGDLGHELDLVAAVDRGAVPYPPLQGLPG